MRRLLVLTAIIALAPGGCRCSRRAKPAGDCATQLPAPSGALAPAEPSTIESSRVIALVVVPLVTMRKTLEAKVPTRVAEEKDRDIGTAGKLSYTVDRSPFVISLKDGKLILQSNLTANVNVCKPLSLLGCQPYASCTPTLRLEATVPIALDASWKGQPSSGRIDVVKRCLVTPLAIDVTPMIESRLATEAKGAQARIDKSVPPFKAEVEKGWEKLQGTLPIAGTACGTLNPERPLQGPAKIEDDKLIARFGLDAHPSIDAPCPEPRPKPVPLPELKQEPALGDAFVLHVPVRLSIAMLREEWSRLVEGALAVGDESLKIGALTLRASKDGLVLDASISGTTCGVLSMIATPAWDAKKKKLVVSSLRVRTQGTQLQAIADALRPKLELSLPLDDEQIAKTIVDLKPVVPGEGPDLDLAVSERKSEGVVVSEQGVEARFELKGSAKITMK